MPAFDRPIRTRRSVLLGLLAAGLAAPFAAAQHTHQAHKAPAKVPELGTGAAVDSHGNLWIASKEIADDGQYVVLQRSHDLGRTWSAPRRIQQQPEPVSADGENRPKLAFGPHDELYVTYTRPLAKPYTGEIRLVRSTDGGRTFMPPLTVHANRDVIGHRFDALTVDRDGRVYVVWIDKRDLEAALAHKESYAGAAIYYAVSDNGGESFKGDYKLADHSCECCRIALALNAEGRPVALWRHVFAPNVRDHALAVLTPDGKPAPPLRATFDDWHVDACPHQGPALAYGEDGTRHQAWFHARGEEGGVFYAAATPSGALGAPMRLGSAQAAHADLAVQGRTVALAWRQFDGQSTAILGKLSNDGGRTWRDVELARTQGASDQPRLLSTPAGIVLVWRTQREGVRTVLAAAKE